MSPSENQGATQPRADKPAPKPDKPSKNPALDRERYKLARRVDRAVQLPMMLLGFLWLVLIVVDLAHGLSTNFRIASYVIWGLFVLQFLVEWLIAPHKLVYLKRHWLSAVALVVPAVRLFAVVRVLRGLAALRGVGLVRIVASVNRGMRALGSLMRRRGFVYVVVLSLMVAFAGAAGMYNFEHGVPGSGVTSYLSALWWTAMVLTTMGSDYFPKSPEGRVLCFLLALYGFAVFGYVTATISSYFVSRDADTDEGDIAGSKQIAKLQSDIAALHAKLDSLTSMLGERGVRSAQGTPSAPSSGS